MSGISAAEAKKERAHWEPIQGINDGDGSQVAAEVRSRVLHANATFLRSERNSGNFFFFLPFVSSLMSPVSLKSKGNFSA